MRQLSIVIPVQSEERGLKDLILSITSAAALRQIDFEVLICSYENKRNEAPTISGVRWLHCLKSGRSYQQNFGASEAAGHWIWFLHADSSPNAQNFESIVSVVRANPLQREIYYFDLQFGDDGPGLCRLNECFGNLRSRLLKMPFGDQSFLLTKALFLELGMFPTHFLSGEDHAFIQSARKKRILISSLRAPLLTSSRKYQRDGWAHVTWRHLVLTAKQELFGEKMSASVGLAIFVKTPGLSPVKTRLARDIGEEKALRAYEWCVSRVEKEYAKVSAKFNGKLQIYWAVAENEALLDRRWSCFPRIWQGEGALGDRLHNIYKNLRERHDIAVVVGADSPLIPIPEILAGLKFLEKKPTSSLIGPAKDGGFYLFGSGHLLDLQFWNSVPYSRSDTCERLVENIGQNSEIYYLPVARDLDIKSDLEEFIQENDNLRRHLDV